MGVIDLDARVKKLESGESGGVDPTVIDQLEAAVTALEAAAVPVKTPITLAENCGYTPITGGDGGCFYCVIGNIVYLNISCDISVTPTALTQIGTLPEEIRPTTNLYLVGFGKDFEKYSRLVISAETGLMTASSDDIKMRVYTTYPINIATT